MGLTSKSTGANVSKAQKNISDTNIRVALAGNPNVGKSTLFNLLTGMNQHTGNWPGKTVSLATGTYRDKCRTYSLTDLPGTYSLLAQSPEEEIARSFLFRQCPDCVVAVCDATCLERNLSLVLQITEITPSVVVCVNLIDEAKKKNIRINIKKLSQLLGLPVVATVATSKKTLSTLPHVIDNTVKNNCSGCAKPDYPTPVKEAAKLISACLSDIYPELPNREWLSLRLLDNTLISEIEYLVPDISLQNEKLTQCISDAKVYLMQQGITEDRIHDIITSAPVHTAEDIYRKCVSGDSGYSNRDRAIDSVVTSRIWGFPSMLVLLCIILWLTITAANYPSQLLSGFMTYAEGLLLQFMELINSPPILTSALVFGVFRTLGWIVSVMLPPMAIFFPLFTLLEDMGYLPRIAYNLDLPFKKCKACGKQALTMCMGLGCNAAGVVGCRIVDSPRERMLAVLTNSFMPCNGKFPILISVSTMFLAIGKGITAQLSCAAILTLVLVVCIAATFCATALLSNTMLKGMPSSYALEMPPYRKPKIGDILVRSVLDRTLFVLGRAAAVAAPAGLVIWLMANIFVDGASLLSICSDFLDPFAAFLGLDGVILMAFILGTPANEIVIPIMLMAYMSGSVLSDAGTADNIRQLLTDNGWTIKTAICMLTFALFHWPCATTLITIKKETEGLKPTVIAAILPTLFGIVLCFIINLIL